MSINKMRVERAGVHGMALAVRQGAETMEEITHQTLKKAVPALIEELNKIIMGESEELLDGATCRTISQKLTKVAEDFE